MLSPAPHIDVHALMRGLVHELRNPLSAILTASSLLNGGEAIEDENAMLLDVVQKESRRMNRILTEFSSFVKPPVAHPEIFDIVPKLRSLVRELQEDGTLGPQIEVRDELPDELPVYADSQQCQQAFHHLLSNAAEAMENGGTLHLHVNRDAEAVHILIDDSGVGFSDEVVARVFQPFFSTKPASTGLGLSIANGLLRASGGEISIHNRFGEPKNSASDNCLGARVSVHLPVSS